MSETITKLTESEHLYAPMNEDELKESEQTNELNGLLEELTNDNTAEIGVYRTKNGKAKGSFLFRCTPSDFTLSEMMEKLRDEYGGGDFRMHVKKNHRLVANRELSVEPPAKIINSEAEKPQDNQQDITGLILAMNENAANRDAAARDSMTQMMQTNQQNMLDLFKVLATSKSEPVQQTSPTELIAMMSSIQGMTQDNTPKTDPMEMLLRGLEMGKDMSGGDSNPLSEMVKAAAGPLAAIASQAQMAPQHPVAVPPRKAEPKQLVNEEKEQFIPPQAPEKQENESMLQFLPYITMLKNAASINAEVGTYANMILDQMGDSVYGYVVDDAKYSNLLGYIPGSEKHAEWFDSLRGAILECFNDDELTLETNEPGNDSNEIETDSVDVSGRKSSNGDNENLSNQESEILPAHD